MKVPNFFIVGAPKCGTTALYTFLSRHPQVFMPPYKKEPHYFASDLNRNTKIVKTHEWIINKSEYFALFEQADEAKVVGEASVFYMYSKTAANEIYHFNPEAKIIIMLRHPVDMVYSLHQQRIYNMMEDTLDFSQALELDKKYINSGGIHTPGELHVGSYWDIALYFEQVKRYLKTFPRNQVHLILYDEFKDDTPRIYRKTLEFLNVDPSFETEFSVINKSKYLRSQWAQKIILARPNLIIKPLHALMPKWMRHQLAMLLINLNLIESERSPLTPKLREDLISFFRKDILDLSALIDRDLSIWLE